MKFKTFRDLKIQDKYKTIRLYFILSLCFNIIGIGILSNVIVINVNHNLMPVASPGCSPLKTETHHYLPDITKAKLYFLSDIFEIGSSTYSIGDFLIYFGLFLFILFVIITICFNIKTRRIG